MAVPTVEAITARRSCTWCSSGVSCGVAPMLIVVMSVSPKERPARTSLEEKTRRQVRSSRRHTWSPASGPRLSSLGHQTLVAAPAVMAGDRGLATVVDVDDAVAAQVGGGLQAHLPVVEPADLRPRNS